MVIGFIPSPQLPWSAGGSLVCGWGGDIWTGEVLRPLFGAGAAVFRFSIPSAQPSIKVALMVERIGTPINPITLTLYNDVSGTRGTTVLANASMPPSAVLFPQGGPPAWSSFVSIVPTSGMLAAGYYWLLMQSPASSLAGGYYLIYFNLGISGWDSTAFGQYGPPNSSYSGNSGTSTIWVQDAAGNDLTILPFGDGIGGGLMRWTAESNYQVNCIVPWLSDLDYLFGQYTAFWTLTDTTTGQVLGNAPASQYYNSHGMTACLPFQLPSVVNIIQGHTYTVSVSDTTGAYNTLIRGSTCDPLKAAPNGISPYAWLELANADFSRYRMLDYQSSWVLSQSGHGGVGGVDQVGVRFVPSANDTLQSASLKMKNFQQSGNYAAGVPVTVSLRSAVDSLRTSVPGTLLQSTSGDSGSIQTNGWFNASGFSYPLVAGTPYWLVWSAPTASNSAYVPQRDVSPWRFLALVSQTSGSTWGSAGQGPSEITWKATGSSTVIGNPFDDLLQTTVDSASNFAAIPFTLSNSGTMSCIYALIGGYHPVDKLSPIYVKAQVYPDNGAGTGPNTTTALGGGQVDLLRGGGYGPLIISFGSNTAQINANTKYWVVLSTVNTTCSMPTATYWMRPSDPLLMAGYDTLLSSTGGTSWRSSVPTGDAAATALFLIGMQPSGTVTTTPTTITVSAKPH